jgi:asparagine synthase (glutamine-hydrolysing)
MSNAGDTRLRGADPEVVREAISTGDPLLGTTGFAGLVDGVLVRDVLGRQPVYVDDDGSGWAFDPTRLEDPSLLQAGMVRPTDESETNPHWTLPDPSPVDPDRAVASVRKAVASVPVPEVPVAFSGGVDSAVVAALSGGPSFVAGFPNSHDVQAARDAARATDAPLHVVELDHDRLPDLARRVATATGRTNAMDVAIAVPLLAVADRVATKGYDRLALGQGADELFGGYAKVANAPEDPRVEADTVRGARRETLCSLPDGLARDVTTVRAAGVEPILALAHDRVVDAALRLPEEWLVDRRGERKAAFRHAARSFVPDRIAFREKKAVQYGTLVDRELDRLARRAGFKRRLGDHVSKYVVALTERT